MSPNFEQLLPKCMITYDWQRLSSFWLSAFCNSISIKGRKIALECAGPILLGHYFSCDYSILLNIAFIAITLKLDDQNLHIFQDYRLPSNKPLSLQKCTLEKPQDIKSQVLK